MTMSVVMLVAGLAILAFAADRFVVAAARLSRRWGISPVLVGALVVGMGTSAPELLVSVLAAIEGDVDLAVGNVVGSNVTNVTLVLGVTAMITPLSGAAKVLRREGLAMLVATGLLTVMLYDLELSRVEGLVLVGGMIVATFFIVRWARQDAAVGVSSAEEDLSGEPGPAQIDARKEIVVAVLSLLATLAGAEMLVRGGTELAESMGVGSAFIGLTLVAVGTSLPELATSVAGARRREDDLVIGNVLGSNLFNALAVAGAAGAIGPGMVEPRFRIACAAMVVSALLAGYFAFTGRKVVRWEGLLLLIGFIAFVLLSYTGGV